MARGRRAKSPCALPTGAYLQTAIEFSCPAPIGQDLYVSQIFLISSSRCGARACALPACNDYAQDCRMLLLAGYLHIATCHGRPDADHTCSWRTSDLIGRCSTMRNTTFGIATMFIGYFCFLNILKSIPPKWRPLRVRAGKMMYILLIMQSKRKPGVSPKANHVIPLIDTRALQGQDLALAYCIQSIQILHVLVPQRREFRRQLVTKIDIQVCTCLLHFLDAFPMHIEFLFADDMFAASFPFW
jgi:hypothetical protein